MMYLRSMIVLTLMSMIGLALPSDHGSSVMTQRKIAKGSKKNPPLFRQKVPVSMVVTQAMTVPELTATVTKAVLDILGGQQEPDDNDRRNLAFLVLMTVQTTETTKTKCPEKYLTEVVDCYDANIIIRSQEDLMDHFPKLEAALDEVIRIKDAIAVTQQRRGGWFHYPYVKVTNKTPYDTLQYFGPNSDYGLSVNYHSLCSPDDVWGIASGDTWTASSRGFCLVNNIYAALTLPDGSTLRCTRYHSSGTSYSKYSIIMDGEDACSVVRIK